MIVAMASNRVIGRDGKLPWNIPEDLHFFRTTTAGHAVIMGRKTHESIGRPLPRSINIVVTRDPGYSSPQCFVVHSLTEALSKAKELERQEIFIIGGAEIFQQSMGLADRLYLTVIDAEIEGDTLFPDYAAFKTVVSKRESRDKNYSYTFYTLEK